MHPCQIEQIMKGGYQTLETIVVLLNAEKDNLMKNIMEANTKRITTKSLGRANALQNRIDDWTKIIEDKDKLIAKVLELYDDLKNR